MASDPRGYLVHEHTAGEIRDIYEVRAALEAMAARLATERASTTDVQRIVQVRADDPSLATCDRERLVEVNGRFDSRTLDAAGNRRLEALVGQNSQHYFNHRIAELYTDAEASALVEGHRRIVETIQDRDPDSAARAASDHVRHV